MHLVHAVVFVFAAWVQLSNSNDKLDCIAFGNYAKQLGMTGTWKLSRGIR